MRLRPFALLASLLALLLFATAPGHAQTIAFTFDDGLDPATHPDALRWNGQLLRTLSRTGVRAMIFPAGRMGGTPTGLPLVRAWADSGHTVGNHTWSHRNLAGRITLAEFLADVGRADSLLSGMPTWRPMLRFPYLKEGDTAEKRDGVRAWMSERGYRPAPVSVDASDWYYNQRYLELISERRTSKLPRLRDAYLAHLWDRAAYYDSLARTVLQRSPAHVLLLHTNAINGAYLGDVIAMFRERGWRVVPPDEAFSDDLYAAQPSGLPAGEGIVWALARDAGVTGLRYPAEDGEYEKPAVDRALAP